MAVSTVSANNCLKTKRKTASDFHPGRNTKCCQKPKQRRQFFVVQHSFYYEIDTPMHIRGCFSFAPFNQQILVISLCFNNLRSSQVSLSTFLFIIKKVENEKIASKLSGLVKPVTKMVTGCLKMTKLRLIKKLYWSSINMVFN